MTRKDYQLVAKVFSDSKPIPFADPARLYWIFTCTHMADALARDNDRFNRDRFLTACGL